MYRFLLRPRWIGFHLLVLVGIVVMVNLGLWQLDRLDARREFNERIVSRIDLPVVTLDTVLTEAAATGVDDLEWRSVDAEGRYLADETVVVVNRSQNGRPGDNVVTPLQLADGGILLVNRGFVPLGIDIPSPPTGQVRVRGVVRLSQERRTGQLSDPGEGRLTEVQRINIDRLADQLPGPVAPLYVDLTASAPAETPGLPEPVVRPDLSDGPHLAYAVQWFIFAAAVALGWILAVRRSIATNRRTLHDHREFTDGSLSAIPADHPTSADA